MTVIMGIGADDIFVLVDSWKLSKTEISAQPHCNSQYLEDRMHFVVTKAMSSTFVTSFTTAAAFGSNMVSSIAPIRNFGVFMSVLVTWNYVLSVSYYPTVLVLYSKCARFSAFALVNRAFARLVEKEPPSTSTRPKPKRWKEKTSVYFKTTFGSFLLRWRYPILVVYLGIIGLGIFMTTQIQHAEDKPSFLADSHPLQRSYYTWKNVMHVSKTCQIFSKDFFENCNIFFLRYLPPVQIIV